VRETCIGECVHASVRVSVRMGAKAICVKGGE
jgi:hypothetical protein